MTISWRLEPDQPPLQVECVVRCVNSIHTGVQFVHLSAENRQRILLHFVEPKVEDRAS